MKIWLVKLAERITGMRCCSCAFCVEGQCCHPDCTMFDRCWQSIRKPGFWRK